MILLNGKEVELPNIKKQKHQFRGAWICSVANIDFPNKQGKSFNELKGDYIHIVNMCNAWKLNAVIVQVRPTNDALYNSKLNPWSHWVSGKQGKAPDGDLLEFMIEETHKRGMEFHAWFNPYRVTQKVDRESSKEEILETLDDKNYAKKHPELIIKYDGKLGFNPGEPKVIEFINDSIMEVVMNYDIDAVHFDDYFYPYKGQDDFDTNFTDHETYNKYNPNNLDINDWRRSNVDKLIYKLHLNIRAYNQANRKGVKFGISPFGIWGHDEFFPGVGSKTPKTSLQSYTGLFCDTRKWIVNEWIDYVIPQIYFSFNREAAPYAILCDWWAKLVKGYNCHNYVGHGTHLYGHKKTDPSWYNSEEFYNQLKFNQLYDTVHGSCLFSYKNIDLDKYEEYFPNQVEDIKLMQENARLIRNSAWTNYAIIPSMNWISNEKPLAPEYVKVENLGNKNIIKWEPSKSNNVRYYLIYRQAEECLNSLNPENIIGRVGANNQLIYSYSTDGNYNYKVTAVNIYNMESE